MKAIEIPNGREEDVGSATNTSTMHSIRDSDEPGIVLLESRMLGARGFIYRNDFNQP